MAISHCQHRQPSRSLGWLPGWGCCPGRSVKTWKPGQSRGYGTEPNPSCKPQGPTSWAHPTFPHFVHLSHTIHLFFFRPQFLLGPPICHLAGSSEKGGQAANVPQISGATRGDRATGLPSIDSIEGLCASCTSVKPLTAVGVLGVLGMVLVLQLFLDARMLGLFLRILCTPSPSSVLSATANANTISLIYEMGCMHGFERIPPSIFKPSTECSKLNMTKSKRAMFPAQPG